MKPTWVLLLCLASFSISLAERDDRAPICMIVDSTPEIDFANEDIDGVAFKVQSQKASHLRATDVVLRPCWWVNRQDMSYPVCPMSFSPVAISSRPGDGDETVWLAWAALYKGEEIGPWVPCLDPEYPDSSGNPDSIFAWYKPRCQTADMPCCGNPVCDILP